MESVSSGLARIFRVRTLFAITALALTACGQNPSETLKPGVVGDISEELRFTESALDTGRTENTSLVTALWEKSHPKDGPQWTSYAYGIVRDLGPKLVAGTNDVTQFCPNYGALTTEEKTSFWVYLVSAVTKYESGYDPTNRFKEPGMGNDPITKQPVYSEGLLQLSYQDKLAYSFCNEFDWAADKVLTVRDPRKTILDPYKNLKCGIQIMNKIMGAHKLIAFGSGHYWSTLKTNSKYNQLKGIKALTNSIAFCRK